MLKAQVDPAWTATHVPAEQLPEVQSPFVAQRSPTLDWWQVWSLLKQFPVVQSLLNAQVAPVETWTHVPAEHDPDVQSPLREQGSPTRDG